MLRIHNNATYTYSLIHTVKQERELFNFIHALHFFFFFGVCIQSPFGVLDFATHCVQECLNRTFPFPDLPYEIITTHIILGCHKISE